MIDDEEGGTIELTIDVAEAVVTKDWIEWLTGYRIPDSWTVIEIEKFLAFD